MKNFLLALILLITGISVSAQTYNPGIHTTTNKAIGLSQAAPTDARSMFFDETFFTYRPYQSTAEVLSYLNLSKYREGKFDIIVNTGGVLGSGVITGGTNNVYYFRNGLTNADLVRKSDVISVNGQIGIVVAKNADSLKSLRIDTGATAMRNNYALAFDSTNRKWILSASGSGSTYTAGTGIDITGTVISALNSTALWNALQLRGRNIEAGTPAIGEGIRWGGTTWDYATIGVDSGLINGTEDTLRLYVGANIVKIFNIASKEYADSIVANIPLNPSVNTDNTLFGNGQVGSELGVDTLNWIATITQINDLNYRIDTLTVSGSGITSVVSDPYTFDGAGITGDTLKIDTTIMATVWYADNLPGITPPDGSETKVEVSGTGLGISGVGTIASPYILTFTGAGTTNPFNALDIRNFGGVANAVTPASGANATGTNCTPALNAMLLASTNGQLCIVSSGEWLFSTAPDSISTKRLNLVIYGNTHHNQQNFIVIKSSSGPFRQHRFIHWGLAWGRENLPTHNSSAAAGGRVSPNWAAYTGTFVTVYNTDQVKVWFNKAAGWAKGVEVVGSGGNGSQENVFEGGWLQECAIGISLRSIDGVSFVDKNKFFIERIGGGLPIKIDGFSGVASNGETWNGAFRSNEFHVLLEFCDSMMIAYGDITEPLFNITVEGGVSTGVLGSDPFRCKLNNDDLGANSSNNYVRSPKWTGQGVYGSQRIGSSTKGTMGINGTIKVPIWNGGSYYGNEAIIDATGQINIFCTNNVSASTRSGAQSYIKFVNYLAPEISQTITAATYTPAANDRYIFYSNAAGTLTLPSATTYPTRQITIINTHATAALSISNIASGFQNSLSAKKAITYRSDGVSWYTTSESVSLPIALTLINATGTDGYVMTTDGTVDGAAWEENHGGYKRFTVTTSASSGTVLATYALPASKGMELDIIVMGYRPSDQTVYRQHIIQGYSTTAGASSIKGSTTVSSYTSDFSPAVFTQQASGTLTYTITVSSAASESVQWSAYIKLRPTFTSL